MAQLGRQISLLLKQLKAFFPAQKRQVVLNSVSQHSVGKGLFLPAVLNVSIWDLWAVCVTLSSQYACLFSHCASADVSLVLPSETGVAPAQPLQCRRFQLCRVEGYFGPMGTGVSSSSRQRGEGKCTTKSSFGLCVGLMFCLPQVVLEIQQR